MEETFTVKIPLSKSDFSLALALVGHEMTPEIWEQIKCTDPEINLNAIGAAGDRIQIKVGIAALLFANIKD